MALALVNPLPQLAINILIVALVLLVLVPGPNRRLRVMTACALFLVGGTLYFHGRSGPRRMASQPSAPALPAPPAPAGPDGVVIADLTEMEGLDVDVSVQDAPRVQFKDGCLVVEGRAKTQVAVVDPASQAADTGAAATQDELPSLAGVRSEIAAKLAQYFDGLVREAAPSSSRLRELRTTLKSLSVEQRRHVADEAAQLRDAITRVDGQGVRSTRARLKPDEIIRLAKARVSTTRSQTEGPGWVGALATIGVLLAASAVLKRVTGHTGVRHV